MDISKEHVDNFTMQTSMKPEDIGVGICGLHWEDTLASASSRLPLKPSSLRGYHSLGQEFTFGPGIPYRIEARFTDEQGSLESVTLNGFPCFPDDAEVETWATVVGPALNEWLAELGFTYDSSQRWQSDEEKGGELGTLGEGDYDYFRSPSGVKVSVTVIWDGPEWMAEFRGPGAPDFEKHS